MKKGITDFLYAEAKALDDLYYNLGDTLDVKASIILVAVTFLGTVSAQVLSNSGLPVLVKSLQYGCVLVLIVSAAITIMAIWPRKFRLPSEVEGDDGWLEIVLEGEEKYKNKSDEALLEELREIRLEVTIKRAQKNEILTERKSTLNKYALIGATLSLALESLSLILWEAMRLRCPG